MPRDADLVTGTAKGASMICRIDPAAPALREGKDRFRDAQREACAKAASANETPE